jgi:hypothetical protein
VLIDHSSAGKDDAGKDQALSTASGKSDFIALIHYLPSFA